MAVISIQFQCNCTVKLYVRVPNVLAFGKWLPKALPPYGKTWADIDADDRAAGKVDKDMALNQDRYSLDPEAAVCPVCGQDWTVLVKNTTLQNAMLFLYQSGANQPEMN